MWKRLKSWLRGTILGRSSEGFRAADIPAEERIAVVDRACRRALAAAGTGPDQVLAVGAGIAAPGNMQARP